MKMLLNISIIAILLSKVMPCDCAPLPSPEEAYEMADAVFSGEVINIVEDWDNLLKEISIDVYDVWKGSIDNQIVILTGIDDGICGYNFQEGLEYLIYANLSGQNLWTNICTRTTLLEDAEEDLEYLNQLLPCDNGYTEYDGECFYNDDLNFLTLLIYLNDIEFELYYDIGLTIWQNGRINTLLLEGMAIHEIPNNIQNLDNLVHLSFSDNELEYLPDAIGNLPSLNSLFLSNNLLIEIPETIGNLSNLEFLHLSGNQLAVLPSTISNLSSLISLNIDNNLFANFPTGLIDLNNLQYLYMANNAINNLPSNIGILSALQILSAYTNDIPQIPSSIGSLSNLYHFDVTNNDLTAIPETICDIYANLTVLNIGLNYICPPYPECLIENDMGYQDTSECEGCCYEEFLANDNCGNASCFIPQCTENCEWEPMQCWGSTGYCWCVDENGIEIEGTSQPSWEGFPDCEEIDLGSTINIPYDYPSIQEGIDAASDGDTILVHPGTYYGPIDFERKNLVIGSLFLLDANESFISETIIMGTDQNVSPFVQIDGISEPEVELNGFTFQDISLIFGDEAQSNALINVLNASPKIINNHFNNFYIDGQAESAVILCNNSSSLIANNRFTDGMIALNYELTGWILSKNSSLNIKNNLMENGYVGFADPAGYMVSVASENIITENTFNNVSMGYCWTCAAIVALDGSSLIISNNLILRATGDGYGAILASESQYVSNNNTLISNRGGYTNLFSDGIVNNDIIINYPNGWGNSVTLDAYSTLQLSYSNIEGGYEGEGNIDISPLFSDAENDDYSLQSASPCIDTGTADLDGDGIDDIIDYYGLAPDMGAYEYESEYDFNLGDVNFDNEINVLDVVLMVSFILGEPTDEYEYSAADINQDGLLNILDIVALINIILDT